MHPSPITASLAQLKRFTCYAFVGAIGTVGHFATLVALVQLSVPPVTASMVGAVVGAMINYWLNFHITFKSHAEHTHTAPRFFLFAGMGFILNGIVMFILVEQWHYIAAQIVATATVLLFTYIANSIWTFGKNQRVK